MRDTAISLKFPPDFSVDFPWFLLRISEDSPENLQLIYLLWIHQKNPHKFCREFPGNPQRINMEYSPQFPRGFSFHLQPKLPRGFLSTMYPPSPGIPRKIRMILPAGCRTQPQGLDCNFQNSALPTTLLTRPWATLFNLWQLWELSTLFKPLALSTYPPFAS